MSKDINNFLNQFSIIGELQNNNQFIGRKQMYDGTQFENFIMVPGSGKSTEGTLTITQIDNYTKLYQTNRDIWGFTTSLRPKEQADITLYLGVNFVPTSLLSEYNIAIGISDGPIDEVYKKVDFDLAAITTKYNDILLRGSYLTNSGQDVVMMHQGQNWGSVSNWGLFNPGGLFNMQIKTNLSAVDFNYSYGYIGTSNISSFTDPTITLTLIKKAQSVVEDKIYVTITETSQDPSSNDQQTGITTISNTPTNYSYVLVNPFPVLNNSGRRFRVTFTNPGNDLSNEAMYIGITDQPTPLNFSTDSSFISYINSKRTLSSLTTLQTAEGFFYTGGIAELFFDSNKLTITKGLVSLDLTAYPSNHIMFGIRTNGLAIQPIQIFFEEVFPVVPPSDFTEAVDSFTNKYTMGSSMWGVVVNKSQQLSAGSAYSFAVNFDGSNLLSNYILAVGITEELVSEVITKANFPNQADALQRFNSLLEKGFFIVSDSTTDPYEIRILEKGTQVSTHQSNLFISGAEGSFTLSVVNSVKLNYGSGETAYFPTTSNTLYLTFAYLKKEFAVNVDSYLMTYSGSLIDVTNPMTNRYTAFPNSLGYKYNFAIPISRLRPSVDKLIITNTNSLSGSEFYCGVTKYNSTGILPFGLAESNFTNTYASTLRGNQTIDFNQVFSSGGTITISTSGNTVEFTNDVGVSTYGINNNNDNYYIFWGTTSSAQFNSITLRYEETISDVVGSGDGTENANTKHIPYDANSWGKIYDLGTINLLTKRIYFERYDNFPFADVKIEIGVSTTQVTNKTYDKATYPSINDVSAENATLRASGILYSTSTLTPTHNLYVNNVASTADNTSLNATGPNFWIFNDEFISLGKTGTFCRLNTQKGTVSLSLPNTTHYIYVLIYKINEIAHDTIKFSYNDSLSRLEDAPFNTRDELNTDFRAKEFFSSHPQNYSYICTVPIRIANNKEWYLWFDGINDTSTQKIYIGVCSNTFRRSFININDFNAFVLANESVNSSGVFQTTDLAFTNGAKIKIKGTINDCIISTDTLSHTFINSSSKFIYVGVKYDTPINFTCYLNTTADEYIVPDKFYQIHIPRYYKSVGSVIAKLPNTFKGTLELSNVSSDDRLEIRWHRVLTYLVFENSVGTNGGSGVRLHSSMISYKSAQAYLESYNPIYGNSVSIFGANHNYNITIYVVDNYLYFKSNTTEFGVKYQLNNGLFFGLAPWPTGTGEDSDGDRMYEFRLTDCDTNVIAPSNHNFFSTQGTVLYTVPTTATTANVGQFFTIGPKIWGDTTFNATFQNAFSWVMVTNFGSTPSRGLFIGFVEDSSLLTGSTYNSLVNFELALINASAWGYYVNGSAVGDYGVYRSGVKVTQESPTYNKSGFAFYNDRIYNVSIHEPTNEIVSFSKFASGLDRSKTYQLVWGGFSSNSFNFALTVYSGMLGGYLGD